MSRYDPKSMNNALDLSFHESSDEETDADEVGSLGPRDLARADSDLNDGDLSDHLGDSLTSGGSGFTSANETSSSAILFQEDHPNIQFSRSPEKPRRKPKKQMSARTAAMNSSSISWGDIDEESNRNMKAIPETDHPSVGDCDSSYTSTESGSNSSQRRQKGLRASLGQHLFHLGDSFRFDSTRPDMKATSFMNKVRKNGRKKKVSTEGLGGVHCVGAQATNHCAIILFVIAVIAVTSALIGMSITTKAVPESAPSDAESSTASLGGNGNSGNNVAATSITEQEKFAIAEEIVLKCKQQNLSTVSGRSGCQNICRNHFCCFEEDDYNCKNDPTKMCTVYAGCQVLVIDDEEEETVESPVSDGIVEEEVSGGPSEIQEEDSLSALESEEEEFVETFDSEEISEEEEEEEAVDGASQIQEKDSFTDELSGEDNQASDEVELGFSMENAYDQLLLIAEQVVTTCNEAYVQQLGYSACQSVCNDHLCCFGQGGNCAGDESMQCVVYAGCQVLVGFLGAKDNSEESVQTDPIIENQQNNIGYDNEYDSNVEGEVVSNYNSKYSDSQFDAPPRPPPPPSQCFSGSRNALACSMWEQTYGMSTMEYQQWYESN